MTDTELSDFEEDKTPRFREYKNLKNEREARERMPNFSDE